MIQKYLHPRDATLNITEIMMLSWCGGRFSQPLIINYRTLFRCVKCSAGVTAIEYALIAALIAVAAIAAFTLVGTNLSNTFSYVASQL